MDILKCGWICAVSGVGYLNISSLRSLEVMGCTASQPRKENYI